MNDFYEKNTARVRNRELLTAVFGAWPSFHDAEILRIVLDRADVELIAEIYVFHMSDKVDREGYYVLENESVVTLRFSGLADLTMNGFNQQNVLWELGIIDVGADQLESIKFKVTFPTSFGLEAEFKCEAIEVVAIRPYVPTERLTQSAPRMNPRSSA